MKHHIAVFIKLNDFLLKDGRQGLQNIMGASGMPEMFQSQIFSFLERVGNTDITQDDWTCFIVVLRKNKLLFEKKNTNLFIILV